jgi:hypothetical protein
MPRWDARGSDPRLRATVRERLASGALFRTGPEAYAGRGTRKPCIICEISISEYEIEHKVVGPTTVWAHWDCYSIWRQESDGLAPSEPTPQPAKTTTVPLHVDRLAGHDGANSTTAEYAVSMGGTKDGAGTVLIAKPKGLSALTALLHGLEIAPAEIQTACRAMTKQPHYEIRHGLNVTPAVLRRLRR